MIDFVKSIAKGIKGITKAFDTLLEFVSNIYDFVIGFIEDSVYVIKLTGEFVADIPNYFSWLPGEALALIVSIFAIVVIYKVLGREG